MPTTLLSYRAYVTIKKHYKFWGIVLPPLYPPPLPPGNCILQPGPATSSPSPFHSPFPVPHPHPNLIHIHIHIYLSHPHPTHPLLSPLPSPLSPSSPSLPLSYPLISIYHSSHPYPIHLIPSIHLISSHLIMSCHIVMSYRHVILSYTSTHCKYDYIWIIYM